KLGFVESLNRPGGNLTGVTNLNLEIGPKRLEVLHALLPTATDFAVLVDPTGPGPQGIGNWHPVVASWPRRRGNRMRRREVISSFGAMAAAPFVAPRSAHAQQTERVRRVGVLMNTAAGEQEGQAGVAAFHQSLQQLGWAIGRNLQIDVRWGENNEDLDRK